MRTINEIEVDLVTVGAQVNDLATQLSAAKAQQEALWAERKIAQAAVPVVLMDPAEFDAYRAKVLAEEDAKEPAEPIVEG